MSLSKSNLREDYILYIGNYLDRDAVHQRKLPTFNVAGSNRMRRLANALRTSGQKIVIVSPAASMRMKWANKPIHQTHLKRADNVPVIFLPAFGLPLINPFTETFILLWSIITISKKRKIHSAIIYNFSPSLVFVSLFLKYILNIRIFNNIEDVSRPKLEDWKSSTEARPIQQLIFSACMDIIAQLSDGMIVPAKRFLSDLPRHKKSVVVSGCMPLKNRSVNTQKAQLPLNILFSGKVEFEHGIHFFINALETLEKDNEFSIENTISVTICGTGDKADWLVNKLSELDAKIPVQYLGFVTTEEYHNVLEAADICVALQNPKGRYGNYKTPSKVYEYLGFGKLVIATPVGDLMDLPPAIIELCGPDIQESLHQILKRLIVHHELIQDRKEFATQYSRQNFSFSEVGNTLKSFILAE